MGWIQLLLIQWLHRSADAGHPSKLPGLLCSTIARTATIATSPIRTTQPSLAAADLTASTSAALTFPAFAFNSIALAFSATVTTSTACSTSLSAAAQSVAAAAQPVAASVCGEQHQHKLHL